MSSLYFGIPILLVASVLQSVWLERAHYAFGRPDLVLLLVVTWSVIRGAEEGALWGFTGGLLMDVLSGSPMGMWTSSLTLVGFVTGQPWGQALGSTVLRLAMMSALGTLLGHSAFIALMLILGYPVDLPAAYAEIVGPAMLLNFLLSPFAFRFLVWFHHRQRQTAR